MIRFMTRDHGLRPSGGPRFAWLLLAFAAQAAAAEITLYEHKDYRGESRTFDRAAVNLRDLGWNDKASSFRIDSGTWELCADVDFRNCRTFRSDEGDLTRFRGWNDAISSLRRVGRGAPEIEVFEHRDFSGRSRRFDGRVDTLRPLGWNDRISSVRVLSGRWQICRHDGYRDCREVGGDERELRGEWNDSISSLRPLRPFRDDDDDDDDDDD